MLYKACGAIGACFLIAILIIIVFAYDRLGLLYAIARALFDLDLSVHVAKIGTYLDQVIDAFYVVGADGSKLADDVRLEEVRRELLDAVNRAEDFIVSQLGSTR